MPKPSDRVRTAAFVLCLAAVTACRSGFDIDPAPIDASAIVLPRTGAWRAVAQAVMEFPGRDVEAVLYVSRSVRGALHATFETSSGLTLLDARCGADAGSVWVPASSSSAIGEAFAAVILGDLSRTLGNGSVFAADDTSARAVSNDPASRIAFSVASGGWVIVAPAEFIPGAASFRTTCADASGVALAEILYEDSGPEGLPRAVTLTDASDGHRTTIEFAQVLPPAGPVPGDGGSAPGDGR